MESLTRLVVAAGIMLVYRWSLQLSTPKKDFRVVSVYGEELAVHVRRGIAMMRVWLVGLITYVPSSQVQEAWAILRERVAGGSYGPAGT